jgi:hypothetical protein
VAIALLATTKGEQRDDSGDLHVYHISREGINTTVTGATDDDIEATRRQEGEAEAAQREAEAKLKREREAERQRMSTGDRRANDPRSPANLQKQIEAFRARNWPQE